MPPKSLLSEFPAANWWMFLHVPVAESEGTGTLGDFEARPVLRRSPMGVSIVIGGTPNGWFIMEDPKVISGLPLFQETSK